LIKNFSVKNQKLKPKITETKRKRMSTANIFKPDGKNAIHDGIEHEPGGGKALLDPTDVVIRL
jgi:hypothetical protein